MLPFKGGMYIFNLMDYQTAGLSLLFISLMEVISIGWIYGECRIIDQTKRLKKVITILYSLSVFSLARSLQLILEISATCRLVSYLQRLALKSIGAI